MKIVHIVPSAPYNDYWGYQDNLLPKYQHKLGYDVTAIVTNTIQKDGKRCKVACGEYDLTDNTHIIRLPLKKYWPQVLTSVNERMEKLYPTLCREKPDFIFFHGLCSTSVIDAIRYKKRQNPRCIIVQDNHLDANIAHISSGIKMYLMKSYYRILNRYSVRYISKVYGVTPWRKSFAEQYYGIPSAKTDVLIMGADDEKIDFDNRDLIRRELRNKYGINDDDFLIVTGGKLDSEKNALELMKACAGLSKIKLLIFGNVLPDIRDEFNELLSKNDNIVYIGWIDSARVYDYFFAADLAVFPGQHSVLWEQACASKIPCVFAKWKEMEHVNNGGNSVFVEEASCNNLRQEIISLCFTDKYKAMLRVAQSSATDIYLYSHIAEKSLECLKSNEN